MGMKKATRERITAAYDKGVEDGEINGYRRAKSELAVIDEARHRQLGQRLSFAQSLESEGEPLETEPEPETE